MFQRYFYLKELPCANVMICDSKCQYNGMWIQPNHLRPSRLMIHKISGWKTTMILFCKHLHKNVKKERVKHRKLRCFMQNPKEIYRMWSYGQERSVLTKGNWRILLGYFGDLNCLGKLHGSILYKVPVLIIICSYTPETHGRNPSQKGILIVFQPQFFQVLQ